MKTTFRLVILILFASSCLLSQTIKLDSGLVAYYPLNSSAQDAGPNGLHGTTNAGVSWSFDRFATPSAAALFGGDSALIRIEDDPLIDLTGDFSICIWMRPQLSGFNVPYMITKGADSSAPIDGSWIIADQPLRVLALYFGSFAGANHVWFESTRGVIAEDSWSFIVFTFRKPTNECIFYTNGNLDTAGTMTHVIKDNSAPLLLGSFQFPYHGRFDDFRLYSRPINAAEVESLYHERGYLTDIAEAPFQPARFALGQNFPNPFNPQTNIEFWIPTSAMVRLSVFDLLGREVVILVNEERQTGLNKAAWDASRLPSGVYFYRLTAGSLSQTRKMILIR
ncbi:MAG: hypothetical protein A2X68_11500 [Ignavibacteria bacterium GWC2_56_12]|nr:MAG: hypothetical protein A2X68_11500 [Ignavibacteria bacterium GWC2_56_12]